MTCKKCYDSINTRDDVLTLFVHLGYLAYTEESNKKDKGNVYIPNLEVADSFKLAVKDTSWKEIKDALEQSEKLQKNIIMMLGKNFCRSKSKGVNLCSIRN